MFRITRSTLTVIGAVLVVALPAAGQQEGEAEEPLEFGVDDVGYTTVYGHDLVVSRTSTTQLQYVNDGAYCVVNEQPNPLNAYLRIPQMPDGAEVVAVRLWGEDTSSTRSLRVCMTQVCYPFDAAGPGETTFPGCLATTGSGGHQLITIGSTQATINNRDCHYLAQVKFNYDGTQNGNPTCVGDDVKFQRLRIDWRRKVSPAPPFATFNDVPTGHPFYQYIEALSASGVTGGCGGGGFCPDAPLTRGQMAVFLAKALGLHWGHPTP